ncbi:MAG: hypothetical protein R3D02_15755 [Hyphomicrobiales bacterium]
MLFTADPIPAAQALNLGVINYVKAADEIDAFVGSAITKRIAENVRWRSR